AIEVQTVTLIPGD
nr:RecName: Full=Isocitrate dehydrogenase [NAD] subunit alpha, mitochondrial; AltName: Full=Isocitric dehydrogenase subunit alpha; AltName: Full=NAD(+)-specific ICDH subunit alpha [Canis lupus familiaris]